MNRDDWGCLGSLLLFALGAFVFVGLGLAVIRVALWGYSLLLEAP